MLVCFPQIFGYFMKLQYKFGRICLNLVQNVKHSLLKNTICKKVFFIPLWNVNCTLLLLQHKKLYSCLWLSLFLKLFWELLNTTITLHPGWRISSMEVLINIWLWARDAEKVWEFSGISLLRSQSCYLVILQMWHFLVKHWDRWTERNLPWLYVVKVIWWCAIQLYPQY